MTSRDEPGSTPRRGGPARQRAVASTRRARGARRAAARRREPALSAPQARLPHRRDVPADQARDGQRPRSHDRQYRSARSKRGRGRTELGACRHARLRAPASTARSRSFRRRNSDGRRRNSVGPACKDLLRRGRTHCSRPTRAAARAATIGHRRMTGVGPAAVACDRARDSAPRAPTSSPPSRVPFSYWPPAQGRQTPTSGPDLRARVPRL